MDVRPFLPSEWEMLRELRLRALESDPVAFGGSVAESSAYPQSTWEEMLPQRVVAMDGERAVGMGGWKEHLADPDLVEMISVWIAPEWRGRGVLSLLVDAVEGEVRRREGEWLVISAFPENEAAVRAYGKLGFRVFREETERGRRVLRMRRAVAIAL